MGATEFQSIAVGLGDVAAADQHDGVLAAYGLGSCVAVCLYDPVRRAAGMAHVVLPASAEGDHRASTKYANIAVPSLIREMQRLGANKARLIAKIAGGAQMLSQLSANDRLSIGQRNVQAVTDALKAESIRIGAADTGGTCGRTVLFYAATGRLAIRSVGSAEKEL